MIQKQITLRHVTMYGLPLIFIVVCGVASLGYVGIYLSSVAAESRSVPNVLVPSASAWELYADLMLVFMGALYALWFERALSYVRQL